MLDPGRKESSSIEFVNEDRPRLEVSTGLFVEVHMVMQFLNSPGQIYYSSEKGSPRGHYRTSKVQQSYK